ncbi:MAG: Maf family nucleotide pyrophosphatase [Clostridia bacterium]
MKLILASGSKDRKILLESAKFKFDVITSNAEEKSDKKHPGEYAEEISKIKAKAVSEIVDEGIILAADTITYSSKGEIFGKPKTREEAIYMIKQYSSSCAEIWTGVTIIDKYQNKEISFSSMTKVYMQDISDEEIETYVDIDKDIYYRCGGYAIDGLSSIFTKKIEGEYANVIGLPITEIYIKLKELGYSIKDFVG